MADLDLKAELLTALRTARAAMLATLDGLSEYDRRRPLTASGTNLLGLVKHLAGLEYGYLGNTFGRDRYASPTWFRGDLSTEIDMWATPDESTEHIAATYRAACTHADATVAALDLDSPGSVAHWDAGHRGTTLGGILVLMVAETARHAGHADILREQIDDLPGAAVPDALRRTVQAAADPFRAPTA
ncbi:hypothetical protein BIV57_14340 [Mangrovactinospora gilvigrisea]|uniref:DinB family protein n=1 Tax=Mangrovactinospora gilvigrisea TaxID=1428644 RepID=A0A1J7BDT1_9ACTN|nr:DinB family protein [Mangrovactinospora gilvigrisea]OIV36839.1 hypothetical protein BIV57_14340 [Mangrovactinospora gilvigrisea]